MPGAGIAPVSLRGREMTPRVPESRPVRLLGRGNTPGVAEIARPVGLLGAKIRLGPPECARQGVAVEVRCRRSGPCGARWHV